MAEVDVRLDGTPPAAGPRWPAGVQAAILVVAALECGWFAVNAVATVGPPLLLWLPAPVTCALTAWLTRLLVRRAELSPAVRRFWRCLTVALVAAGLATASYALDALYLPGAPTQQQGPLTLVGYGCAVIALIYGMIRMPANLPTWTDRLTLGLDLGAVMLTTAIFTWYFVTAPSDGEVHGGSGPLVVLGIIVVNLVSVFAVARLVLSGTSTLDRGALRMLGTASTLAAVIGTVPGRWLTDRPLLVPAQYCIPVCALMMSYAIRRQWRALSDPVPFAPGGRRRPFSVLPYVAVAATDALLVYAAVVRDREVTVACGAVALTGVVVIRQVASFRENARLLETIRRHESRFRSLVQNGSDIVFITSREGLLTYVSPAIERVLGWRPEECVGRHTEELVHPDDVAAARTRFPDTYGEPGMKTVSEARLAQRDGRWRWFEVTSANLIADPGVSGIVSNARDVTEARRFQERLTHEATHDALTGLANRVLFGQRLATALSGGAGSMVSVALIDLDDFKVVNDTLGHGVGDQLLAVAAERLRASVRTGDTVARLGGDEFAVLSAGASAADMDAMAGRIVSAFSAPVPAEGHELSIQASIGMTTAPAGAAVDGAELLRQADVAMYAAKATRGGRHVHYTPELGMSWGEQAGLGARLRRAIDGGQLRLVYQPVVTLPAGRLVGVEALVRWQHPDRGVVGPDEFIPFAERSGLIVDLGRWVLENACAQLAAWDAGLGPDAPGRLNVNVSVVQLADPEFPRLVRTVLADAGLTPARLTLEVTETVALAGVEPLRGLRLLRAAGVRISLDDFGTGHSALATLAHCPADELKLDRSLVEILDPAGAPVAAALVPFAAVLGAQLVAEGVETEQQARQLHALGYHLAQGYLFSPPVPADQIPRFTHAGVTAAARSGPTGQPPGLRHA
jgi:diguanylate cyclase (GGDEF)-like protein/PAS domain S-box-containing protein